MRALSFLLVVLAFAAVACGGEQSAQDTTTAATETEPRDGDASRPEAPVVAGTTLDGERLALSDFRGKPVLVNIWSAW